MSSAREDERHIDDASERSAVLALDRAIVRGRLDRRRAMIALAVRHTLAALQRRGMTELRVVAHRSVDVEHARLRRRRRCCRSSTGPIWMKFDCAR